MRRVVLFHTFVRLFNVWPNRRHWTQKSASASILLQYHSPVAYGKPLRIHEQIQVEKANSILVLL